MISLNTQCIYKKNLKGVLTLPSWKYWIISNSSSVYPECLYYNYFIIRYCSVCSVCQPIHLIAWRFYVSGCRTFALYRSRSIFIQEPVSHGYSIACWIFGWRVVSLPRLLSNFIVNFRNKTKPVIAYRLCFWYSIFGEIWRSFLQVLLLSVQITNTLRLVYSF